MRFYSLTCVCFSGGNIGGWGGGKVLPDAPLRVWPVRRQLHPHHWGGVPHQRSGGGWGHLYPAGKNVICSYECKKKIKINADVNKIESLITQWFINNF